MINQRQLIIISTNKQIIMQQQVPYVRHKTPNILVTGTPGTGKTTFCQLLNQSLNFKYLAIGSLIKQEKLYEQWDDQLNVPIFQQELLINYLTKEHVIQEGGLLIDFHSPTSFPPQWFDLIIIMRCNNQILYKRLEQRQYQQKKITENIQCQIFQEIKMDCQELFADRMQCVIECRNQQKQDMQSSIQAVMDYLIQYKQHTDQLNK